MGAMVATGGTKTGIAVTYQDSTGDMDFVVDHDAADNFVAAGVTLTGFALSTGNYAYRRKVQADKADILLQPGKELDEYDWFQED